MSIFSSNLAYRNKTKKQMFMSTNNQNILIKKIYQRHVEDGGQLTLDVFNLKIPHLMKSWHKLDSLDSYESLIWQDPDVELLKINEDFERMVWPEFSTGRDYKTIPFNYLAHASAEDMRNLDIPRTCTDINTNNQMYRFDNTIPLYQRQPARWYARDNYNGDSGLKYASYEQPDQGNRFGDMSLVAETLDKPYKKVDTLDTPYYGQELDDYSYRLTDTLWETK